MVVDLSLFTLHHLFKTFFLLFGNVLFSCYCLTLIKYLLSLVFSPECFELFLSGALSDLSEAIIIIIIIIIIILLASFSHQR